MHGALIVGQAILPSVCARDVQVGIGREDLQGAPRADPGARAERGEGLDVVPQVRSPVRDVVPEDRRDTYGWVFTLITSHFLTQKNVGIPMKNHGAGVHTPWLTLIVS